MRFASVVASALAVAPFALFAVDGRADGTAAGATEAMAVSLPGPRILLVDEGPFRGPRPHVRERTDPSRDAAMKRRHHGRPFHPAPGIVVDVPGAEGGANAADLQRAARNLGYWPFRRCYEEGLRRDQRLSGKVFLDMTVAETGIVRSAAPSSTTLTDENVVMCVAREAQRLSFAATASETRARLSVTLWPGDEPVPVAYPAPHAAQLRDALRASWPALRRCYKDALAVQPDAGGPMDLHFRVGEGGEVLEVAEQGETRFAPADVTRCVLGVYRAATLPALGGGSGEIAFEYSLHFEAAPAPGALEQVSLRAAQSASPAAR
jgi:hypothetical protein